MLNKVYNVFGTFYAVDHNGFVFSYGRLNKKWLYQGAAKDYPFVTNAGLLVGLNWRLK